MIRKILITALFFFLWNSALSDSITITRLGSCDWACYDENHIQLSCHQGWRKATEACANRALSDGKLYFVYSAQYRIEADITAVDEDPPGAVITLSWTPPTHNEDGTLIPAEGPEALDGYELWMSLEANDNYELLVNIEDETRTEFSIIGADPNTYYFKGQAYNNEGIRSKFSGTASKTIE